MKDFVYATLVILCFTTLHAALRGMMSQSYHHSAGVASRPSQPAVKEEIPSSHQSIAIGGAQKAIHVSVYEGNDHESERIVLHLT